MEQNPNTTSNRNTSVSSSSATTEQQAATAVDSVSLAQVGDAETGAEVQEAVVKVSMKQFLGVLIPKAALKLQTRHEQSVEDEVEGVLVAKGVDYDAYLQNSLKDGVAWCGRLEYINGEVWMYEFTNHPAHEAAAGVIMTKISIALGLHNVEDLFSAGASPSVDNDALHLVFEPDGFVKPRRKVTAAGVRDRDPNIVVEVAFSETQPHVLNKAAVWIGPGFTVQQVIVIKIGARARVGGGRTMRAWSYVRGAANPVQGPIDFDQVAGPGAAGMQLHINHAQLLVGAPAATNTAMAAVPNPIVIDLFHVQQQILDDL